jgi:NlpC/P60 family putative phage cell wall peptidase
MTHQDHIIRCARGWIGTPYRHQASVKHAGCDCLGLVRGVWRELYGAEAEQPPPYAANWAEAASTEALADAARRHMIEIAPRSFAGSDLLLFRWRAHLPA